MLTSTTTPTTHPAHLFTVGFVTLGCKTNLLESSSLAEQFKALGWQVVTDANQAADLYVFNTCTVTEKADSEARRLIRQLRRKHPNARVAVTGCYAQVAPEVMAAQDGVDFVIGNGFKDQLPELVAKHFTQRYKEQTASEVPLNWEPFIQVDAFEKSRVLENTVASNAGVERTRASLKIQDGCDYKCTYCIIWKGRGPSRSLPPSQVLAGFQRLVDEGFQDISLTGINIGQYWFHPTHPTEQAYLLDETPEKQAGLELPELLDYLCQKLQGNYRLRLTSLDPLEVTDALMETLAKWQPNIAPHVHLSTQSADDEVLKAMARRHKVADLQRVCARLVELMPDVHISSDVIVGFPTETEAAFQNTLAVLKALPMHSMHVFRYSPRPGTPAATLKPQVPERVRKERAQTLSALAEEKRQQFLQRFVGKTLPVLVENTTRPDGLLEGLSHNYLRVLLQPAGQLEPNTLVSARIKGVSVEGLQASVISLYGSAAL
jgi:threonylcarbamoyladenosine tRNA methylthiotransferase MtaB